MNKIYALIYIHGIVSLIIGLVVINDYGDWGNAGAWFLFWPIFLSISILKASYRELLKQIRK